MRAMSEDQKQRFQIVVFIFFIFVAVEIWPRDKTISALTKKRI